MRWFHHDSKPAVDPDEMARVFSSNVALADRLNDDDLNQLVALTIDFIGAKRWEALAPLELTPEMQITIAANACVPILKLGLDAYSNVGSVIVYHGTQESGDGRQGPVGGVVSEGSITTIGQASPNSGPVSLSWEASRHESRHPEWASNVVIHEFAHKLDMQDGYTDGIPLVDDDDLPCWDTLIEAEFTATGSDDAESVLRPYAYTNKAEFFAVGVETFFTIPTQFKDAMPKLYGLLSRFFGLDPASWEPTPESIPN